MERLRRLFREWAGEDCQECAEMGGGGSSRRYFRLRGAERVCIGTIGSDRRENEAFFSFSAHLRGKGMTVPEVYAKEADGMVYLQEDLGDRSLYTLLHEKRQHGGGFDGEMLELYKRALADLDAIQRAGRDADFSKAFPRADFDRRAILWDLNYFKYNFLKLTHIPFDEELLEDDFERFAQHLLEADCSYFMYRDFQGRNIMVDEDGGGLHYIDYQGGRRGAAQYDVCSLLYSAKSALPEVVRRELLAYYVEQHGEQDFLRHYWAYVLIRIMQTLGAYGYRGLAERKPYFKESIPLAVDNLRRVVEEHRLEVSLPELERVWERIGERDWHPQTAEADGRLHVRVVSFSYKKGLPEDESGNGGGHVFDCRALPNPGRYEQYKAYTGKDATVKEFLQREKAVGEFLNDVEKIVGRSVDKYVERHFSSLMVCFGCTGGQHRSVYCAEKTAEWLRREYPEVEVSVWHREQETSARLG